MNAQLKNMFRNKQTYLVGIFICLTVLFACKEPEARRPVSVASGSYLKQNIQTAQQILKADTTAISQYLHQLDSIAILSSNYGFKYYVHSAESADTVKPKPGQKVLFTYAVKNIRGEIIYDTTQIGQIQYVVDKEKHFEGLREAVKLLSAGQTGTFFFPSALAYGNMGDGNRIGPNQPLICTVTLLEIKPDNP